ncbi:GtrA family protein [Prauserella oleivorans]|uniref:GtrA family protein n=1 Tax=Prauserella oleivorans TaxID=1478153 RepID=A0ABW5W501_9PSEU
MTPVPPRVGTAWTTVLPERYREFARHAVLYLAAGGASTVLQALLFLAVRTVTGPLTANLVAIGATTLLNTEFHRLVTFAGTSGPRARRHIQTLGTFAFYAGAGSVALFVLHTLAEAPSPLLETAVLVATSVLGGICRFLLLRSWVFGRRPETAR